MTYRLGVIPVLLVLCLTAVAAAQTTLPAGEVSTKEQVAEIVKAAEAAAKEWFDDDTIPYDLNKELNKVRYGDDACRHLCDAMSAARKDPLNIFVINKLLDPVIVAKPAQAWAKPELCRKLLPTVKQIESKLKYADMPKHSKEALAKCKLQESYDKKLSADQLAKLLDDTTKARAAKLAAERPLALHNEELGKFKRFTYRLMAAADDPKEDAVLIKLLEDLEKERDIMFKSIVEAIWFEAPRMKADRAKLFYDALVRIGDPIKLGQYEASGLPTQYRDYANTPVDMDNNSGPRPGDFECPDNVRHASPGALILYTANALAKTANAPAVKVPNYDDVSKEARARRAAAAKK